MDSGRDGCDCGVCGVCPVVIVHMFVLVSPPVGDFLFMSVWCVAMVPLLFFISVCLHLHFCRPLLFSKSISFCICVSLSLPYSPFFVYLYFSPSFFILSTSLSFSHCLPAKVFVCFIHSLSRAHFFSLISPIVSVLIVFVSLFVHLCFDVSFCNSDPLSFCPSVSLSLLLSEVMSFSRSPLFKNCKSLRTNVWFVHKHKC